MINPWAAAINWSGAQLRERRTARRRTASPLRTDPPEIAAVLGSDAFSRLISDQATSSGRPVEEVLADAREHLRELAASHDEAVTVPWNNVGRWMTRGYQRLLDEEGLAELRALDGKHSLAFLISHRSYLDEWAVPPALIDFGIRAPFGFAGANLDFFPLGSIARRTGIVHIRRSTAGAPVYKLVLRAFMRELVSNQANLIWSIEGGRTRTGKLRPPRFGLLRYVIDAVAELDDAEVLLVPVSILYDQLPGHEVELMTSEALGKGKTPEDAKWFLGYVRGLRRRMGRVYVDFGEPIALGGRLDDLAREGVTRHQAVERIALEVSHRINLATPVTPTAAVCVALLGVDRALTLDEILETVEPLAQYLSDRDWPTAGAANLMDRATVRRAVDDLAESGVVTRYRGETTVWGIGNNQHLVAAVYRNSAIHVLVLRGILELVIARAASDDSLGADEAWRDALALRELLKFEFFFPARDEFGRELRRELELVTGETWSGGTEMSHATARALLRELRLRVSPMVLRPFVDAYAVVADQLVVEPDEAVTDQKVIIDRSLSVGRQWALQRRIVSEESVSSEMFQTALRLAAHRGLLEAGKGEERRRFVAELAEIRRRIARVERLAESPTVEEPDISPPVNISATA